MDRERGNHRIEWNAMRDFAHPAGLAVIREDELGVRGVALQAAPCSIENGLRRIREEAQGVRIILKDRRSQYAVPAAEIEEPLKVLASRRSEQLQHGVDLFNGERHCAANVLQKAGD